jgi:hypothetical protein
MNYSGIYLEGLRKTFKTTVRIAGDPVDRPNTGQESYCYAI